MGNKTIIDKEIFKKGQDNTPGKKSSKYYIQSGESWVGASR